MRRPVGACRCSLLPALPVPGSQQHDHQRASTQDQDRTQDSFSISHIIQNCRSTCVLRHPPPVQKMLLFVLSWGGTRLSANGEGPARRRCGQPRPYVCTDLQKTVSVDRCQTSPISSRYLCRASFQSGRGVNPACSSLFLSSRLLKGRAALLRPYSSVVTGRIPVFRPAWR